jgi:hypothetical protein
MYRENSGTTSLKIGCQSWHTRTPLNDIFIKKRHILSKIESGKYQKSAGMPETSFIRLREG